MLNKKVSIIMSTYNVEGYIIDCLESILKQTYNNFEVLIVDDNSSDSTVKTIESVIQKDARVKIINVNSINQGLTKNLNKLIQNSTGEYIARMDADDICEPNRLEEQVKFLEENKEISVVGSIAYQINDEGHKKEDYRKVPLTHEEITKTILTVNPMIHPSTMFRKEKILNIGGYNEDYRTAQDYELWFRCIANNLKLANINKPLLQYRVADNHASKRSFSYRMLDAKIRWNGTKNIGVMLPKRVVSVSIPLIIGALPLWARKLLLKYAHKFDPRQKLNVREEK